MKLNKNILIREEEKTIASNDFEEKIDDFLNEAIYITSLVRSALDLYYCGIVFVNREKINDKGVIKGNKKQALYIFL